MNNNSQDILISLVIPVYNEEESLDALFKELFDVMNGYESQYEIILVDDCSSDRSPEILKKYETEHAPKVRVITIQKRSGQTEAMRMGIQKSRGRLVATLDADLQNDPADILRLVEKMKEGFDCVCGWRRNREDKWLKARLSKFGNVMQRLFTGMKIHDVSCTLRIYTRECARAIPLNWEGQHRFIPLSLSLQGYKLAEIVSNHRRREFGISKYTHKRIFKVAVDFFRILIARGKQ